MDTLMGVAGFMGIALGAIFAIWAVGVCVYLIGSRMKDVADAYDLRKDGAAVWGWGFAYSAAALTVLFLLVRFVKFAWTLE